MGRLRHTPLLTVVLCTACAGAGGSAPLACTAIGASSGIGITVAAGMADSVRDPAMKVCGDTCETYALDLRPGSETVDLGCGSSGPDGSCSASVRPNGSLVGFLVIEQLDPRPLQVTLIAGDESYSTSGTAQTVHPNGPGCPGQALQLSLTLDAGELTVRKSVQG